MGILWKQDNVWTYYRLGKPDCWWGPFGLHRVTDMELYRWKKQETFCVTDALRLVLVDRDPPDSSGWYARKNLVLPIIRLYFWWRWHGWPVFFDYMYYYDLFTFDNENQSFAWRQNFRPLRWLLSGLRLGGTDGR